MTLKIGDKAVVTSGLFAGEKGIVLDHTKDETFANEKDGNLLSLGGMLLFFPSRNLREVSYDGI